jgi:hypothetical protein
MSKSNQLTVMKASNLSSITSGNTTCEPDFDSLNDSKNIVIESATDVYESKLLFPDLEEKPKILSPITGNSIDQYHLLFLQ